MKPKFKSPFLQSIAMMVETGFRFVNPVTKKIAKPAPTEPSVNRVFVVVRDERRFAVVAETMEQAGRILDATP